MNTVKNNNIEYFKKDCKVLILPDGRIDLSGYYILIARFTDNDGMHEHRSILIRNDLPEEAKRQHALDFKKKVESL